METAASEAMAGEDAVSVGRGDAAVRSREAMDRIADAANEQVAQRDTVTWGKRPFAPSGSRKASELGEGRQQTRHNRNDTI